MKNFCLVCESVSFATNCNKTPLLELQMDFRTCRLVEPTNQIALVTERTCITHRRRNVRFRWRKRTPGRRGTTGVPPTPFQRPCSYKTTEPPGISLTNGARFTSDAGLGRPGPDRRRNGPPGTTWLKRTSRGPVKLMIYVDGVCERHKVRSDQKFRLGRASLIRVQELGTQIWMCGTIMKAFVRQQ